MSHELLIMHRRAPTCFLAYISWRTKSCIPPHPLQTTSSPLYPNQEAPRHVFFLFFSVFFTETLWWLQQRRTVKRKRALMLMLLTTTVDHCWRKTDSWLHPVQGSAVDAIDTDQPEKGMCTQSKWFNSQKQIQGEEAGVKTATHMLQSPNCFISTAGIRASYNSSPNVTHVDLFTVRNSRFETCRDIMLWIFVLVQAYRARP